MEQQGVTRKIEYHTDWCSSMTTVVKKGGSIRICLDPRRLNNALKRCPNKVSTLEEVQPFFARPKYRYFSKLDAKAGYCQDIFQQHMDRIVQNVPGCICIADDIAIVERTEGEHDKNLYLFMESVKREGVVFNSSKSTIKKEAINFFGSRGKDQISTQILAR
ncbi:uncharacterized protein LOC135153439 [Lytechinus pictus]|uniref:uncharacterized protein LOC135153439 n=1 Tax=Lytechinus pictus TaxID=7653 RepID=UPI0030BA00ED